MNTKMSFILVIAIAFNFACGSAEDKTSNQQQQLEEVSPVLRSQSPYSEPSNVEEEKDVATQVAKRFEKVESEDQQPNPVSDRLKKRILTKTVKSESIENEAGGNIEDERQWPIEKTIAESQKPEVENLEPVEEVVNESEVKEMVVPSKPDHSKFNDLLSSHVSSTGVVDYDGLKGEMGKLETYLEDLSSNPVASDWSKNEKLAYWINAYNAFTIKLILDHYPVSSIQDISNGKPWDQKWIKIGGKTYSLNQIENDIIRPDFKEPRIHFAVNCAAKSCPPLANKAFTADNLNSLLEKQTKAFINNSKYNTIKPNAVKISKIFDWYGVDFGDKIGFLNKYSDTEIKRDAKVEYVEYDWSLNN